MTQEQAEWFANIMDTDPMPEYRGHGRKQSSWAVQCAAFEDAIQALWDYHANGFDPPPTVDGCLYVDVLGNGVVIY